MCLAPTENMVKWKINYTLTVKSPTSTVKPMQPSFYLQMISKTHRQRERERERELEHEHTPHTVQNPDHASPQPSSGQPRLCRPIAQITRRPSFLFFLSSSSTSPPSRSKSCILFSSSPPKTNLIARH